MKQRVLDFIADPSGDAGALALEIFAWQVEHSPIHRRFAAGAAPSHYTEIPAVPVSLCKHLHFCVGEPGAIFRTSGTTSGLRGEHAMVDTQVYEASLRASFAHGVPDAPRSCISLCPTATDSSLGHMISVLYPDAWTPDSDQDLDEALFANGFMATPVFLATTAFALAERLARKALAPLIPGSVLMVTGGFKGRTQALSPEVLELAILDQLGPHVRRVDEYGMTELASPLWGPPGQGFRAPPWLLPYTVEPLTGRPTTGEGLLRFVDLANWSSLLAIETEDVGIVEGDRVFLRGRLPGAQLRGCSLVAEEARL